MSQSAKFQTAALLLALMAVLGFAIYSRPAAVEDRVYRIGFGSDPPLHFPSEKSGQAEGLAVGVIREAARQQGIRLEWTQSASPGIPSLISGETDLWVAMTVLEERRRQIFISDPFLVTEYCLLVLADSPFSSYLDLTGRRISHPDFEIHRVNLHKYFPSSALVPGATPQATIEAVVSGAADAAFIDQFSASRALMELQVKRPVRILSVPVPQGYLGLASNFRAAPAARAIRDEIRRMIDEGAINTRIEGWSFYPLLNLEAINNLSKSRRREQAFVSGLVTLICLLICTVLLVISLRRDHSRLVDAKAALRESEEHYRGLVELLPDTIYLLSRQGELQSVVTAPYTVRRTDDLVLSLAESETHLNDVQTVLKTGAVTITEQKLLGVHPVEYRLIPLRGGDGVIDGVLGILRDQTARQAAEDERNRLEEQLRQSQKMEVVGRLAGGIAHDFNNLLTVINGYSESLLKQLPRETRVAQQISKVLKAGNAAADLTRQLLTFSRKQQIEPAVRDLNGIVSNAADMLRRLLGDDIELELILAPELPLVLVDTGQMEQVLMNLAANARDAMLEGGRFVLETSLQSLNPGQAAVQIGAVRGPHVVLTARDTGTGIHVDTLPRIFDPFFTTKQDYNGTGLGLSIVYGIVRQCNGWITISTEIGRGTAFELHFPAAASQPLSSIEPSREVEELRLEHRAATILLVEDRTDVRVLVADLLRGAGYTVLEAISPASAIHFGQRHSGVIDVLLTDVVMPAMRGTELAKRLRQLRPELKVLFMTGFPGQLDLLRDNLVLEGAVLAKPFGPETLLATLQELIAVKMASR